VMRRPFIATVVNFGLEPAFAFVAGEPTTIAVSFETIRRLPTTVTFAGLGGLTTELVVKRDFSGIAHGFFT